ncbi:MAG: FAD-binding protein, partial [Desulfobulbia bacterium]
MVHVVRPSEERELSHFIEEAADSGIPLEVRGVGTKKLIGRPVEAGAILSSESLSGITLYEPSELVLSAGAGTPLADIEDLLARYNQQLAFEPIDLGPVLGEPANKGSIGAVFATNLSGSRRIYSGAARDHFLGMRAINGRGELFKSGGRVMKNVTGYDLCRALSGSWGTLAFMTEVTMKVLPVSEESRTLLFFGLPDDIAIDLMCDAMGTPYEISAASHIHSSLTTGIIPDDLAAQDTSITALRLENFRHSLNYRMECLSDELKTYGQLEKLDNDHSLKFWSEMRSLRFLHGSDTPVWRIVTPPASGARLIHAIQAHHPEARPVYDWSGGLVWLLMPALSDAGIS